MKRQQVISVILSVILSFSACLSTGATAVFAAEDDGFLVIEEDGEEDQDIRNDQKDLNDESSQGEDNDEEIIGSDDAVEEDSSDDLPKSQEYSPEDGTVIETDDESTESEQDKAQNSLSPAEDGGEAGSVQEEEGLSEDVQDNAQNSAAADPASLEGVNGKNQEDASIVEGEEEQKQEEELSDSQNDPEESSITVYEPGEEGQNVYCIEGESVSLFVSADSADGTDLSYAWYKGSSDSENKEAVNQDADDPTFYDFTPQWGTDETVKNFSCCISSGQEQVWRDFRVIRSVLRATAVLKKDGEETGNETDPAYAGAQDPTEAWLALQKGDRVSITVSAAGPEGETLSYEWQYQEGEGDWMPVTGDPQSSFTSEALDIDTVYECTVKTEKGETASFLFYITLTGQEPGGQQGSLLVYPEGNEKDDPKKMIDLVETGLVPVTLVTTVENDGQYDLTYLWEKYDPDTDNWAQVEGDGSESSYTVQNPAKDDQYRCVVTDQNDNDIQGTAFFTFFADTQVIVIADGPDVMDAADYPDGVTLAVNTSESVPNKDLTYRWSSRKGEGDYAAVEGAEGASCFVEHPESDTSYRCTVTNQFGDEDSVEFSFRKDNHLKVYAASGKKEGETAFLDPSAGGSFTLSPVVTADVTDGMKFQWLKNDLQMTGEEAVNRGLTVTAPQSGDTYECIVTDCYGNTASARYEFIVDTHLTAYPKDHEDMSRILIGIDGKKTVTLTALAQADEGAGLTYSWYAGDDEPVESGNLTDQEMSYTVTDPAENNSYKCVVTDKYGIYREVTFVLKSATVPLSVSPEGDPTDSPDTARVVYDGRNATYLRVREASDDYQYITGGYEWKLVDGTSQTPLADSDPNSRSYYVGNPQDGARYSCTVTDLFGQTATVCFVLEKDTLSVEPVVLPEEGDTVNRTTVSVTLSAEKIENGTSRSLKVNASDTEDDAPSFVWKKIVGDTQTQVGNTAEYRPEKSGLYRCSVTNKSGRTKSLDFVVSIENNLTASAQKDYVEAVSGEDAQLQVNASASAGSGTILYKWYRIMGEGAQTQKELIDGAEGNSCTISNVTENGRYQCDVTDKYDSKTVEVSFNVAVAAPEAVSLSAEGSEDPAAGVEIEMSLPEGGYVYDGVAKEPAVTVKYNGTAIATETDYTVEYIDNTDAGKNTAKVAVTGKEPGYKGRVVKRFSIAPAELTEKEVIVNVNDCTYNGSEQKPLVWLDWKDKNAHASCSPLDGSFDVSYENNIAAGNAAEAVVVFKGNYRGTIRRKFKIASIEQVIEAQGLTLAYPETAKLSAAVHAAQSAGVTGALSFASSDSGIAEVDSDGNVTAVKPGAAMITITAAQTQSCGKASASVWVNIEKGTQTIEKTDLSLVYPAGGKLAAQALVAQGEPGALSFVCADLSVAEVDGEGNITSKAPGTAVITITAAETDYYKAATKQASVTVLKARQTINASDLSLTYPNGGKINVTGAQGTLSFVSSDPSVADVDGQGNVTAKKAGTVKITITAAETDFYEAASKTVTVTIAKAAQTINASDLSLTYPNDGKITVTGAQGTLSFVSSDPLVADVDSSGNVTVKKAGTAKITITAAATEQYAQAQPKTITVTVAPAVITTDWVTLAAASYTYDGNAKSPAVTVKRGGTLLKSGADYSVAYKSNINAGQAEVTVTGKGSYTGTVTRTFTISKADQAITGPASVYKKKFGNKAFFLKASARTALKYSSSNGKIATVNKTGKVTIKGAGSAKITITASASANYNGAKKVVTIKVAKIKPTFKINKKDQKKTLKLSALKKKSQTFSPRITVNSKAKITYSLSGVKSGKKKLSAKQYKKLFTVNKKSGKITVVKGIKKGVYTLTVKASAIAKGSYLKGSNAFTITVTVK